MYSISKYISNISKYISNRVFVNKHFTYLMCAYLKT